MFFVICKYKQSVPKRSGELHNLKNDQKLPARCSIQVINDHDNFSTSLQYVALNLPLSVLWTCDSCPKLYPKGLQYWREQPRIVLKNVLHIREKELFIYREMDS